MTSHEILQAQMLDIIFEGRNKQYGAYQLRKQYDKRLVQAVAGSIVGITLLLMLLQPEENVTSLPAEKPEVMIGREVQIQSNKPTPPPPIKKQPQKIKPRLIKYTSQILIDPKVQVTDVPHIDVLANSKPGAQTIDGSIITDAPAFTNVVAQTNAGSVQTVVSSTEIEGSSAPQFPGGSKAWSAFLSRYLQVPAEMQAGEKVTVVVRFLVKEDGTIGSFQVIHSGGAAFDAEVISVLKKMPRWKPAMQSGKPISVTFTQPVTFVAAEE